MAVKEIDTLMQRKDEQGNLEIHYPVTNADNVMGLTEKITQVAGNNEQLGSMQEDIGEIKDTVNSSKDVIEELTEIVKSIDNNTNLVPSNLDVAVSTRASAETALSNEIWTDERAGNLDLLTNSTYGLSALRTLMNTVNNNTLSGAVKSVQRGSAGADSITSGTSLSNTTRTISISTIDASKSIILISFENLPADSADKTVIYGLSNSAISQSSYYYGQGRQHFCAFGYQVVEFY